jgi:hypothetical protein
MDASEKTIRFLRKLTADGYLTGDEVWSLGKFFTENEDCAEAWPGNVLAPMIESAFDDSLLSEEEMRVIAETIGSIEEESRAENPALESELDRELEGAEPVEVRPALLPVINAKFEIPAKNAESYLVQLKELSCTCPDWQERSALPPGHPGRCCKHVAHAFTRTGKVFEPWLQALLDDCFAHGRGTNPSLNWLLLQLPTKPALVGGGSGPWCSVYAPAQEGYEKFAFNPARKVWSYGVAPARAPKIERAIHDNFAPA